MAKKALGRGLDSLISGGIVQPASGPVQSVEEPSRPASVQSSKVTESDSGIQTSSTPSDEKWFAEQIMYVALDHIEPNRNQPRTEFEEESLHELAQSIRERGVMQPLVVRPSKDDRYELIAGERRWRAARDAGLSTIPVIIRPMGDQEALELALIENLQREDLNPIEEAHAYDQLVKQFGLTQEEIAGKVTRSRAAVANSMRLLGLPEEIQSWVADSRLSVGHAKAILGLSIPDEQKLVADRVLRRSLTVRDTEQLVEQLKGEARPRSRASGNIVQNATVTAIEEQLRQKLGTHVNVRHGKKKGRIEIEYYGNEDLSRLLNLLGIDDL